MPWLHADDAVYTFGQADAQARRRGRALESRGVGPGDRVVVALPNSPEFVFTWFGLMAIGGVLVAVNPDAGAQELGHLLAGAEPRLVLTDAAHEQALADVAAHASPQTPVTTDEALTDRLAAGDGWRPAAPPGGDDLAVFIATSGTTGRPKLVMHRHRTYVLTAEAFPWWLGLTAADRLAIGLPLFHLNAQAYSTLGSLAAGAGLVLLPWFSARAFWDEVRHHGATQFNAIGAMVEMLMRQPARPDDADHPVRQCYLAPAPSRQRHVAVEERFGLRLQIGYALSESPFGLIWPREGARPYESMGAPRQHPRRGRVNEARVVDDAGADVAAGAAGELLLANPATMVGYFNQPDETDEALRDGWLHTGDLVRTDAEGWFYFVARRKELIRRRGENIAPAEVEAALNAHDDVAECAVVGVPSELTEEEVKAFVRPADGAAAEAADLAAWCAERLTAAKVPRYVELVDALPYTPTGRVAKAVLPRERTAAEYDHERAPRESEPHD